MHYILIFMAVLFFPLIGKESPIIILNMTNEQILPKNFRTAQSPFSQTIGNTPSTEGLKELRVSGSGQFSQLSWGAIVKKINYPGTILDIDLRQESHGFLNGDAISLYTPPNWINLGKTNAEAQYREITWLESLKKTPIVTMENVKERNNFGVLKTKPIAIRVKNVLSEEQMIAEANAKYLRLYITDHMAPLPSEVDKFISIVQNLPADTWIHLHCKAGKGRTTTFMALFDIMHNAKKVSFNDIIQRQMLIGGRDLFKYYSPSDWKAPHMQDRIEFLKKFYNYARNNTDNFKTLWSKSIVSVAL